MPSTSRRGNTCSEVRIDGMPESEQMSDTTVQWNVSMETGDTYDKGRRMIDISGEEESPAMS